MKATEAQHASASEIPRGTVGHGSADDLPASDVPLKKGRKRVNEFRANEIRARLAEWKQLPQFSRPSLRALAREVGTSHQLLGHYLRHWEVWQAKEYQRQANELRKRARAEMRPWAMDEMLRQARAYDQAAFRSTIEITRWESCSANFKETRKLAH